MYTLTTVVIAGRTYWAVADSDMKPIAFFELNDTGHLLASECLLLMQK